MKKKRTVFFLFFLLWIYPNWGLSKEWQIGPAYQFEEMGVNADLIMSLNGIRSTGSSLLTSNIETLFLNYHFNYGSLDGILGIGQTATKSSSNFSGMLEGSDVDGDSLSIKATALQALFSVFDFRALTLYAGYTVRNSFYTLTFENGDTSSASELSSHLNLSLSGTYSDRLMLYFKVGWGPSAIIQSPSTGFGISILY